MGTRGAIGFVIDGVEKIWYNQFDSYPDGLGQDVVKWVQSQDLDEVKQLAKNLKVVGDEVEPEILADIQKQAERAGTINLSVSNQSMNDVYCLLREAQGDIDLTLDVGYVQDSSDFLKDSLFCEYAYIINFDTNKLEFYEGFNKYPGGEGRYAEFQRPQGGEYYGVALVGESPLNDIPDWWIVFFDDEENSKAATYVRKAKVQAIQWNTRNIDDVIEFCSLAEADGYYVNITDEITAEPGDFIIKEDDGGFSVMTSEDFFAEYEWDDE